MNTPVEVESAKQFDPKSLWENETLPIATLGEGLSIVRTKTENFSPTFVKGLLEKPVFGPDRCLDQKHVNRLLENMKRGTFRWELVQIIFCSLNRITYRMNGQHTGWARINWDDAPSNLPVKVIHYRARSEKDLRMLYATIDRGKPRTKGDVINSYIYGSDEFAGLSKPVIRQLAEGLSFWAWGENKEMSKHDGDEVAYLLQTEFYGLAVKVGAFLQTSQSGSYKHLKRSPVYAAMYATFKRSETAAIDFWEAVKLGASLSPNDARLKLRNKLMTHAINAGRGGASYKNMIPANDMFNWCIAAWNAYRNQEKLSTFRQPKNKKRYSVQ